MITAASLLAIALQVGLNQPTIPLTDGHEELRERAVRAESEDANIAPESAWLAECLDLIDQDPARAHTLAQLKRNETVGAESVLANHCLGLAATELELWQDAITAFSAARDASPVEDVRIRARFGTMAGLATMASGDAEGAVAVLKQGKQDAALAASAPLQAIAATHLARALVTLNRNEEALTELDLATSLEPGSAESWLLKATLLRRMDRLDDAQTSIERAHALAPADPQVGLEAGIIALFSGNDAAAQASWQSVIDLAPDTPIASLAQDYLTQLDAVIAAEAQ